MKLDLRGENPYTQIAQLSGQCRFLNSFNLGQTGLQMLLTYNSNSSPVAQVGGAIDS